MIWMKKTARGAKRTICSIELMATRMAQYSPSPPASPVQMRTCSKSQRKCSKRLALGTLCPILTMAMHLPRPTRMRPARRPGSSGKKAHDKPSWYNQVSAMIFDKREKEGNAHHEKRRHDPVHDDTEQYLFPHISTRQNLVKRFISYFAENGIHHDEQADRWRVIMLDITPSCCTECFVLAYRD